MHVCMYVCMYVRMYVHMYVCVYVCMYVHMCTCADIYVSCVSSTHNVTAKGFYLVLVATTVETDNPEAELKPGLDLLGAIKEKYVSFLSSFLFFLHSLLKVCFLPLMSSLLCSSSFRGLLPSFDLLFSLFSLRRDHLFVFMLNYQLVD